MSALVIGALGGKIAALTNRGQRITATGAGTFTPTVTGWHDVICQGAGGGSGGVKFSSGVGTIRSGGGEAGEYVRMRVLLTAGVGYTTSVGTGGTAGSTAGGSGGNGGNTTFAGPDFTITALGGAGSAGVLVVASTEGAGGTATGRRDGNTTAGQPSNQTGPDVWAGANGGTSNGVSGGYAGCFQAGTSSGRGGSGGCSIFAAGGNGAAPANTSGTAGTQGSGAGGSWTTSTTGVLGAVGGNGLIEIAYVGTN
jgi:hypothetical protein